MRKSSTGDWRRLPAYPRHSLPFAESERASLHSASTAPRSLGLIRRGRLEPIDDLDTLIELCSRLIESLKPMDERRSVRRCDLSVVRPAADRLLQADRPARDAAATAFGRTHEHVQAIFCARSLSVVRSWLTGEVPDPFPFDRSWALDAFISLWVFSLATRVARAEAGPLLSAPTHSGGWIDPRELVTRFRQRSDLAIANEPADLILALLRLAPDYRSVALDDAGRLAGRARRGDSPCPRGRG